MNLRWRERITSVFGVLVYSFRKRPNRGSVSIYVGVEGIAYVHFDDDGRVEDVFVGGS